MLKNRFFLLRQLSLYFIQQRKYLLDFAHYAGLFRKRRKGNGLVVGVLRHEASVDCEVKDALF